MQHWVLGWNRQTGRFAGDPACAGADFVLFFAGRTVQGDAAFESLRRLCPAARILGCSTGSVISGMDVDDDIATAVAVKLERSSVRLASVTISEGDHSFHDGCVLARQLPLEDLAGVLVLSDGLHVNGSALVSGLQSVLGASVPVGGGLAGDGSAFAQTFVSADAPPRERLVAALGFYGDSLNIGLGAAHGWRFFGPVRRITRSRGAMLHEMDGKPALDHYERYLGEEVADLPASALLYPLLISNPAAPDDEVVRTVLSVDRQARTMTFAGDVPEGWTARLMRGVFSSLSAGAAEAAEAAAGAGDSKGLALLVSCVGRRLLMGQRAADEVEAVSEVLSGRFHQFGFYSYGEIATQGVDGWCGLHNQTMTVMTF